MNYRGGLKSVRYLDLARQLRHDRTSAEIAMWKILRGRRFMGLKFRRQHPFRDFVFDFYCVELKLAVELDGAPHFLPEIARRDDDRTAKLQKLGLTVVRIENQELLGESRVVMERIERVIRALAGNAVRGTSGPHP